MFMKIVVLRKARYARQESEDDMAIWEEHDAGVLFELLGCHVRHRVQILMYFVLNFEIQSEEKPIQHLIFVIVWMIDRMSNLPKLSLKVLNEFDIPQFLHL